MSDTITATILGPDGRPAIKAATLLTLEEAELLMEYSSFLKGEMISAEMGCRKCGEKMEFSREGRDIGIICGCRMLFWRAS